MGKSKTGKALPKGICQRKDGMYSARYLNGFGKRVEKHFNLLSDAKQWLENERYEDNLLRSGSKEVVITPDGKILDGNCTVDEWHQYWLDHIVNQLVLPHQPKPFLLCQPFNIQSQLFPQLLVGHPFNTLFNCRH